MQVDIFTICDAATSQGSRLNILGTFDTIETREFPCTHDSYSVVARVRFSPVDPVSHTLDIRCVDLDGVVVDAAGQEEFDTDFANGLSYGYSLIWNIRQKEFLSAAEYHIELLIDGHCVASVPLFIQEKKTAV